MRSDPKHLHQPIQIKLDHNDTQPVRDQKMFKNVASVEIAELKDALAYAERLLAQNLSEKEALMKKDAEHNFEIKKVEDRLRETNNLKKKAEQNIT